MRRTKEDAAITRERLLDAALEIFHAKGYAATTLDDIARRAEITRGAIQWHFGNKAELFNTLIRERYQQAQNHFQDIFVQGKSPLQLLREFLVRWLTYVEEDYKFRIMLELVMMKTEITSELSEGMKEKIQGNRATVNFFARLLREGIASGELRPDIQPETTATAALGLINGVTTLWLMDPSSFSLRDSSAEMVDLFLRGISQA